MNVYEGFYTFPLELIFYSTYRQSQDENNSVVFILNDSFACGFLDRQSYTLAASFTKWKIYKRKTFICQVPAVSHFL